MSTKSTTDEVVVYQLNDTGDEEILVTVPPGLTGGWALSVTAPRGNWWRASKTEPR